MSKLKVSNLFKLPEDAPDRQEAITWARQYDDNLAQAIAKCPRGDWLIWMMSGSRIEPKLLIAAAYRAILLNVSKLEPCEQPFETGLEIVEKWLSGTASSEDCQSGLDELDFEQLDLSKFEEEESDLADPNATINEMVSYLLNACLDISSGSNRSDLAYNLARSINTAAKLRYLMNDAKSLQEPLAEHAKNIREFLTIECLKEDGTL